MLNGFDPGPSLWVALAVALVLAVFFIKARLNYKAIPSLGPGLPDRPAPDCMVVIPARNEQATIARAVASFPPDTVIVVDDASSDATAESARKAGAGVLPAPKLASGAVGKSSACAEGARVLTSKWILFADADTWFEPGFLQSAVACAEASNLAFLSFHLRPEWSTWTEALLSPYAAALYYIAVGPKSDDTALFNGHCILVGREPYEFVGGHRAVLNTVIEDVKLAALARRHRMNFGTARADQTGHVILRDPRQSFRRAAYRFLLHPGLGITIMLAALTAALWLPALIWLLLDHQYIPAAIFALVPTLLTLTWYRNPLRALTAPVAIYAVLPILLRGFFSAITGRRVIWKGRQI